MTERPTLDEVLTLLLFGGMMVAVPFIGAAALAVAR
jgi:hypothetical protein